MVDLKDALLGFEMVILLVKQLVHLKDEKLEDVTVYQSGEKMVHWWAVL